jgi:hypothetical protein
MSTGLLVRTPPSISRLKGPVADTMHHLDNEGPPLSNHSLGVGACGLFFSRSKDPSSFVSGLNFVNAWYANNSMDLFLDFRLNFPGINAGVLFGVDYFFNNRSSPLYVGLAAGPQYLKKAGASFQDRAGASFKCHAGYIVEISRQMQLRVQVPYMLFAGTKIANTIGIELQCIFFGPYRDVKVLHQ